MSVYDLRREYLNPKEFENITSPNVTHEIIDRDYQIIEEHGPTNHIDNFHFAFKNPLYSPPPHSLFHQHRMDGIYKLVKYGDIVMTTREKRTRITHPFFIAESSELFCVDDFLYDRLYINKILHYFRISVLRSGKPKPTRSSYIPVTKEYGPGYWKTIDNDYHFFLNLGVMAINRATSMGDEGRLFMSEGKDFANTLRSQIQVWSPFPQHLTDDNMKIVSERSVIRRYGDERSTMQRYLESDDAWTVSGSSWQWIPGVKDEDYEFKK
ncbi:hypothetical protein [Trabulsiella odontotermitis]|uniref:hypothetical protein n=1 Tax=Trabulsiella odontotermitis TaxID=379893 RepID=UPI00092D1FAA|nr:hypothetical protein [Trabulsiella odontotermitis]